MKALRQKRKSIEQKKKKEVRHIQEYRLRVKLQDPKFTSINEDKAAYKSRWTEWRAVKWAKNALPSTPIKRAKIVAKILDSPNTKYILVNQGVMPTRDTMEKAHIGEAFLSSFNEKIEEVNQRGDVWNRRKCLPGLEEDSNPLLKLEEKTSKIISQTSKSSRSKAGFGGPRKYDDFDGTEPQMLWEKRCASST